MRERILSLSVDVWPAKEAQVWRKAQDPGHGLFGEAGAVAHLSRHAIRLGDDAYGQWLHFLLRRGVDLAAERPVERVTRSRLDQWIEGQRARGNRNTTILARLQGLHRVLMAISPEAELDYILRPDGRPLRQLLPAEPRWTPIVGAGVLLARAIQLFHEGRAGRGYSNGWTAVRDAAVLGLLATVAPRIGSVGVMEIGVQLVRAEDGYAVTFRSEDTKNRKALSYPLHPELAPVFQYYLDVVRPLMRGGAATTSLWMGTRGRPLCGRDLAKVVRRRCRDWLGEERGPHWFRKCLRSTATLESPELAHAAARVLGHTEQTSLQNYDKASSTEALKRHGARISKLRRETEALAASAYGWRTSKLSRASVSAETSGTVAAPTEES